MMVGMGGKVFVITVAARFVNVNETCKSLIQKTGMQSYAR